jgi:murein DD-endopeptidase MepM/ murein hydrolase activator NlpD
VRRGDLIGKVGNTGNSSEPHLHIHITDGPSFVGANGVPYVFDFALSQRVNVIQNPANPEDISFTVIDGPVYRSVLETFLNLDLVNFDRPG